MKYYNYSLWVFILMLLSISVTSAQGEPERGTLNNDSPYIEYPITVETDNSQLMVDLTAVSGDLDTLLYLVDADGNIMAENDDREDGNTNSYLKFDGLQAGAYKVVATRYDVAQGETSGDYELDLAVVVPPPPTTLSYDVSSDTLAALGYPMGEATTPADWTILAFYGADTNLEGALLEDLNEFELAGGSDQQVRVVVLLDRNPSYTDSNDDWSSVRLFEVGVDASGDHTLEEVPTIDTPFLADLGELDTGDGATLAQFLAWGVQHYPADHYAIALGSHGAGWRGLSTDETSGAETGNKYTIITLPELRGALEAARALAGVEKFDLLINDACLMSSIEYHTVMTEYFQYSVASPEIVVNPALDMTLLTETIHRLSDSDLTALGTQLIDQYISVDILQNDDAGVDYYTHSMFDLAQFPSVAQQVEAFAALINTNPSLYVDLLGRARSNAYTYTAFLGDSTLIDLGHFMEQVIVASSNVEVITAAERVLEALEEARLYGKAGERAERWSYYYNIYFPEKLEDFDRRYFAESPLQGWGTMLDNFYKLTTPRRWLVADSILVYHPPSPPKVTITSAYPLQASATNPPTIQMEIVGRRIAKGSFTVDQLQPDGYYLRLLHNPILTEIVIGNIANYVNQWRAGVDQSSFSWVPMTLPVVTDGTVSANELLLRSGNVAILEGRYRANGGDWQDVAVIFSLQTHQVQRVINRAEGTGALAAIEIPMGAEFQSYRQIVASDGDTKQIEGVLYTWGENGLTWSEEAPPVGDYRLGFLLEAYGGITGFDSVDIQVVEDAHATTQRGYTALDLGVNFRYPADWLTPFDTGEQLVTGNTENTQNISVVVFNAPEDNPWKIAENFQVLYGLSPLTAPREISLNEQSGVEFDYSYTLEDQLWYGRGVAVYRQTARLDNTSLIISAESQNQAEVDALYADLLASITFFDSAALLAQDTSFWTYRQINPTVIHPLPRTWTGTTAITAGEWSQFSPPDAPQTFASVAFFAGSDPEAIFNDLRESLLPADHRLIPYVNEYRQWAVAEYTHADLVGRLYVTKIVDQVYAVWVETPNDDTALGYFRDVFEPMVDGFAPPSNVQYALGGLDPLLLKAALTRASLTCERINPNDACYGEGSLVVESVDEEAALSAVGDTVEITTLREMAVGIREDTPSDFDPLSIAVIEAEVPTDQTTSESVRVGVFGGIILTIPLNQTPTPTP